MFLDLRMIMRECPFCLKSPVYPGLEAPPRKGVAIESQSLLLPEDTFA